MPHGPAPPQSKILILIMLFLGSYQVLGQRYIGIDKKGLPKTRIQIGDDFHFKQRGNRVLYHTILLDLADTAVFFGSSEVPVALSLANLEAILVQKKWPKAVSLSATFVGGWFLIAGAAEAIGDSGNYSASNAALIGTSLIAVGQLVRFFKWKRYRTGNFSFRIGEHI